ncbi:hypothetical protein DSL92_01735 [Billgrantia gudaonensis]|uniref:Uncharacterized protein n=1 Tax=Billgrantia gudaonensis TaxID=376427 RepID=A0A3S0NHN4_9GAMM|nr:hypothetical protein DSL92_01735 [Halomonas gudaonensis]
MPDSAFGPSHLSPSPSPSPSPSRLHPSSAQSSASIKGASWPLVGCSLRVHRWLPPGRPSRWQPVPGRVPYSPVDG